MIERWCRWDKPIPIIETRRNEKWQKEDGNTTSVIAPTVAKIVLQQPSLFGKQE